MLVSLRSNELIIIAPFWCETSRGCVVGTERYLQFLNKYNFFPNSSIRYAHIFRLVRSKMNLFAWFRKELKEVCRSWWVEISTYFVNLTWLHPPTVYNFWIHNSGSMWSMVLSFLIHNLLADMVTVRGGGDKLSICGSKKLAKI